MQWLAKSMNTSVNQLALDFINSSREEIESEIPCASKAVRNVRQFLRYDLNFPDKLIAENLNNQLSEWKDLSPLQQRVAIRYASAMRDLDIDEIREVLDNVGDEDLHLRLADLKSGYDEVELGE